MTTVHLDASDAAELAEMLTFIGHWLTSDPAAPANSLQKFTGGTAYTTGTGLARFAFLPTGEDAGRLFGGRQQ